FHPAHGHGVFLVGMVLAQGGEPEKIVLGIYSSDQFLALLVQATAFDHSLDDKVYHIGIVPDGVDSILLLESEHFAMVIKKVLEFVQRSDIALLGVVRHGPQ